MRNRILNVSLLTIFLLLVCLTLNKEALYALVQRKVTPPGLILQGRGAWEQETWDRYYQYMATNIFDKGYVHVFWSEFIERLSVHPENTPVENRTLTVSKNSSRNVVKMTLPEGFRDGILSIDSRAASEYLVGVSYDLDNWEFSRRPGYSGGSLVNAIRLKKGNPEGVVYLKFIPERNESLTVFFEEFQYVSDLAREVVDYGNLKLFGSDVDIDYNGKITVQPRVTYEEYKSRGNF